MLGKEIFGGNKIARGSKMAPFILHNVCTRIVCESSHNAGRVWPIVKRCTKPGGGIVNKCTIGYIVRGFTIGNIVN